MSRLLTLQNQLKARAREGRLAEHQLRAYRDVREQWRFPQRLNLYGPAGAGKTFLGWALAYELGAIHFGSPDQLTADPLPDAPVIIDNVSTDAYPLRRLLARLELLGVRRVLFISRAPSAGLLPAVPLAAPDEADRTVILHNLSELDYYALQPTDSANLWALIRATL